MRPSSSGSACEEANRARVARRRSLRKRSRRQLDHERRCTGKAAGLPPRRRAGWNWEAPESHARESRVPSARDEAWPGPGADERLRLVEPERHVGANAEDEPPSDAAFGLGQRPWPRVRRIPAPPDWPPARREVPVEINASRVLPRPAGEAVGVQVVDEPEVERGTRAAGEESCDPDAGALVSVDAADNQNLHRATGVADLDRPDRPAANRVAEHLRTVDGLGRDAAFGRTPDGDHGEHESEQAHRDRYGGPYSRGPA
jgi:hypothetical protein